MTQLVPIQVPWTMAHVWGISRPVLQPPSVSRSFHSQGQTAFLHQALYAERSTHQPSTSPDTRDEAPAAAAVGSSAGDLLSWSFVEGPAEEAAQQQQQQQQRQQQQQQQQRQQQQRQQQQRRQQSRQRQQRQQQPEQGQQHKRQQPPPGRGGHPGSVQQRDSRQHRGLGTTTENAAPARGSQQRAAAARSGQRQQQGQRRAPREPPQATGAPAAGLSNAAFRAAQQRVLQLLVEADISNPAAAAEQLPDSVDEVVIALQLLATAPRPREHTALRQYEDAAAAVAAAVIAKLKRLLLSQQQQQQQQLQQGGDDDDAGSSAQLAAALAQLPATKVAAATFALGVLRQYDPCLVPALEAAAGQLLARSAFSANQLGQLAQGFAYLDHTLSPGWQHAYLAAVGQQLPDLTAAQLASLSEFLLKYQLRSFLCGTFALGSSSVDPAARAGAAAAAGDGLRALPAGSSLDSNSSSDLPGGVLPAAWVSGFLAAAGSQAHSLKPSQLAQVLAAAAAIQQQQQATSGCSSDRTPAALAGLPLLLEPAADGGTPSSSSGGSWWLVRLLAEFQRLLPDMTMPYLAAALPALAALTHRPWPEQQLRPVLLQVRLLLPAAGGREAVAAAAGAAQLAGSGRRVSAVDGAWCDALLQRLHVLLPGLGAAELASVIRTLLLLTVRPYRAWVYELCARLRVEVPGFGAAELVGVLEGLAGLRIVLDPEVLHLFVIGVKRWLPLLGQGELAGVAGSLRRMYPRGLPGRTVQQLVEEVERRGRFLQLQQQL